MDNHETHHDDIAVFGFWVYLMSDCVLFASLFATYAVLRHSTFGGPSGKELFDMPSVLFETFVLLTSSFTCGLALLAIRRNDTRQALIRFGATLALGLIFLGMEVSEFVRMAHEGNGPQHSAFLSSFFTLVGTHGLHIAAGSIALIVLMLRLWRQGLTPATNRRLVCLGLFWHFLDVVWIFIFSLVYLIGGLS